MAITPKTAGVRAGLPRPVEDHAISQNFHQVLAEIDRLAMEREQSALPRFLWLDQVINPDGTVNVTVRIDDPQNRGGRLTAWVNKGSFDPPDPESPADGSASVPLTPATILPAQVFDLTAGGTDALLTGIMTPAASGKRIFLEFRNTDDLSTGIRDFVITGDGGVVLPGGGLAPGAITARDQFIASVQPLEIVEVLPASCTKDQIVVLATDGRMYRCTGGIEGWVPVVRAPDLSGVLTREQLEDEIIDTAKIAQGLKLIRIVTSLPATGTAGETVSLGGMLYTWDTTTSTWKSAARAADLSGLIQGAQLVDAAIASAKLADRAVISAKVALAAVTSDLVAAKAINGAAIADRAVASLQIALSSVQGGNLSDRTLSAGKMIAYTLTSYEVAAATITGGNIAGGTITAGNITSSTITSGQIAASTIVGGNIAGSTITGSHVNAGTIASSHIATRTLAADRIASNVLTTSEMTAGGINADRLVAGSVTADRLVTNSITAGYIATGAIGADEIAANAVNADKIAAYSIYAIDIVAGQINGDHIAANSIDAGHIVAFSISTDQLASNSIVAGKIQAGAIGVTHINAYRLSNLGNTVGIAFDKPASDTQGFHANWTSYISFYPSDYHFLYHPKFRLAHNGDAVFLGTIHADAVVAAGTFTAARAVFKGNVYWDELGGIGDSHKGLEWLSDLGAIAQIKSNGVSIVLSPTGSGNVQITNLTLIAGGTLWGRVKVGALGTGPGGTGRALYVD